jgi:hypothetical protein
MGVLVSQTSSEDVAALLKSNILRVHRTDTNLQVKFESRLAEQIADAFGSL